MEAATGTAVGRVAMAAAVAGSLVVVVGAPGLCNIEANIGPPAGLGGG